MNNFLDALKKYLDETPREQILKDWEKSKDYDNVGPTVEAFIKTLNIKNDHN